MQAEPAGAPMASKFPAPPAIDAGIEERILAPDPRHITENDVRTTRVLGPVPRIILLHGGVAGTELPMVSFGKFLVGMGYPESPPYAT
jgi:hypothetical protein